MSGRHGSSSYSSFKDSCAEVRRRGVGTPQFPAQLQREAGKFIAFVQIMITWKWPQEQHNGCHKPASGMQSLHYRAARLGQTCDSDQDTGRHKVEQVHQNGCVPIDEGATSLPVCIVSPSSGTATSGHPYAVPFLIPQPLNRMPHLALSTATPCIWGSGCMTQCPERFKSILPRQNSPNCSDGTVWLWIA